MSEKHLASGSMSPPRKKGVLRLYSMKFCPYSQRVRMVLLAKQVPHEVVNINLQNKPDWFMEINPYGKVPTLDDGKKIITESTDICDYIDELYPDIPLYPSDPVAKAKDKELIKSFGNLVSIFYTALLDNSGKQFRDYFKDITPYLETLEEEFNSRGATYFGGGEPGMVDYMMWPFTQRFKSISMFFGDQVALPKEAFHGLREWRDHMLQQPVVQETMTTPEQFYKIVTAAKAKEAVDYDSI